MNYQASVQEPREFRYSFKRCDHGVVFAPKQARETNMTAAEVQKRYPRLVGECPLGCGFVGVAYANRNHWWRFHNDRAAQQIATERGGMQQNATEEKNAF